MKFFQRIRAQRWSPVKQIARRVKRTRRLTIEGLERRTLFAIASIAGADLLGSLSTSTFTAESVTTSDTTTIGTAPRITQSSTSAPPAEALVTGDFNGDGIADLAIGMPSMDVPANDGPVVMNPLYVDRAGAVRILYGERFSGLGTYGRANDGARLWDQNQVSGDGAQVGDRFGASLAAGDFNGDGYDDLAIGSPGEDNGTGTIHVLYGSPAGLGRADVNRDPPDAGTELGTSLAAGDFDGDGFDDLAVGVPSAEQISVNRYGTVYVAENGAVRVYAGSRVGLDLDNARTTLYETTEVNNYQPYISRFGETLSVGDFNGDGKEDLAVGAPHKSVLYIDEGGSIPRRNNPEDPLFTGGGYISEAGAVYTFHGSSSGLSETPDNGWHQTVQRDDDSIGIAGSAEAEDHFGQTLAAGDFNGDGKDDLAVGVPHEDVRQLGRYLRPDAGAVNIIYGSPSGLTGRGNEIWHQDDLTDHEQLIEGEWAETNDWFGAALTAGDFNGDGRDDLAIGVPGEDDGYRVDSGTVHVLSQVVAAGGLSEWWEGANNLTERIPQANARFGFALAAADFDGNGYMDLTVGAPSDSGMASSDGTVVVEGDGGEVHVVFAHRTDSNVTRLGWRVQQTWYESEDLLETWDVRTRWI